MRILITLLLLIAAATLFGQNNLTTIEKECLVEGKHYIVQYTYNHEDPLYMYGVTHINNPHFLSDITVYAPLGVRRFFVWRMAGVYVKKGCTDDICESWVRKAIRLRNKINGV